MAETGRKPTRRPVVPRPDRKRELAGTPFGWIDGRILREGWLQLLSAEDVSVYMFLCLAANRDGVSYYRRGRMGEELGLGEAALHKALQRLYQRDLVAYQPFHRRAADGFHQVLSLPARRLGGWT